MFKSIKGRLLYRMMRLSCGVSFMLYGYVNSPLMFLTSIDSFRKLRCRCSRRSPNHSTLPPRDETSNRNLRDPNDRIILYISRHCVFALRLGCWNAPGSSQHSTPRKSLCHYRGKSTSICLECCTHNCRSYYMRLRDRIHFLHCSNVHGGNVH